MNISNVNTILTSASQRISSVAKTGGGIASQKSTPSGNFLPELAHVLPPQGSSKGSEPAPQPNAEELGNLVAQANDAAQVHASHLKFSVAEGTDINVVRIEDSQTGELIRQIPSEAMVAIARALAEQSQGTMLEERV